MGHLSKQDMAHLRSNAACDRVNDPAPKRSAKEILSQPISLLHLDPETRQFRRTLGETSVHGQKSKLVVYSEQNDDENSDLPKP